MTMSYASTVYIRRHMHHHRRRACQLMPIDVLFVGVPVWDLDRAIAWYERLFGKPFDIHVNDNEVMWQIVEGGWLYVVVDPERAGKSLAALAVPDLDGYLGDIESRGISRPLIETMPGGARKASFIDPDGNTIAFLQVTPAAD